MDLLIKLTENNFNYTLPRPIMRDATIYFMGYSFYDTVLNVSNFSLNLDGVEYTVPNGNYSADDLMFELINTKNAPITYNARTGSTLFTTSATANNGETAKIFNMETGNTYNAGYDSGLINLSGNRVFYIDIDKISSNMMSNTAPYTFKIFNPDGGGFNHVYAQNYNYPQTGSNCDNLSFLKINVLNEEGKKIKIDSPVYLHFYFSEKYL